MKPLDQQQIRSAMANSTRGEASRMVFPAGFGGLEFSDLEYLGWRDPKAPQRGYLISWYADRPVGIALRAPEGASKKSVMCTLCRSTHSSGGVALFAAPRHRYTQALFESMPTMELDSGRRWPRSRDCRHS